MLVGSSVRGLFRGARGCGWVAGKLRCSGVGVMFGTLLYCSKMLFLLEHYKTLIDTRFAGDLYCIVLMF